MLINVENRPDQISAISGLRILAAWMIFLHHYRFELGLSADSMLLMLMTELHVGVAVFFVSSGFLCAYNYHYKLRSKHFIFRDFIYKRWARLYPLYLTLLLAGLYLHEFTVIVLLSHLTLTHGFIISHIFTLFPQTWALTVMFCFYCTISLIDQVLGRTWKSAIYIPLLLICTSCIIALVLSQLSSYSFNEIH